MTCTTYPSLPAIPSSTSITNIAGWNGGGVSQDIIGGNLHAVWSLPSVVGVVCGFAPVNAPEGIPSSITHGFYFWQFDGQDMVIVLEKGVSVGSAFSRSVSDTFEIRRVFDSVQYFSNKTLIYRSTQRSNGLLVLSAALYMTGDAVG